MGNDAAIFELDENMNHEALVFYQAPDQIGTARGLHLRLVVE